MTRPLRGMLAVAAVLASGLAVDAQRFTSSAVAVRVDVLVTHDKQLIRGLTARDFDLRDEGVPQSVAQVDVEQLPLNLILVFDTSGSVAGRRLQFLLQAGRSLLDGLGEHDRVALLSFSTRVRLLSPLTPSRQQIRASFDSLQALGPTSLRDAAFAGLALREADPGRTLLLLFSDGADTSSWLNPTRVIETAKRTDAVVYAIGIREQVSVPITTLVSRSSSGAVVGQTLRTRTSTVELEESGKFLKALAEETGGRVLLAGSNADLHATFTSTLAEFRDRYVLSYTPTGVAATGWHQLDVRLKGRKGKVTARRGYFAR